MMVDNEQAATARQQVGTTLSRCSMGKKKYLFVYTFLMLFKLRLRDALAKIPQNTHVPPSHRAEKKRDNYIFS